MRWTVTAAHSNNFPIKRRFRRTTIRCRVGIFANYTYKFVDSVTLGEGGMLLKGDPTLLNVGQEIELHFYLPGDEFIDVRGVVLYHLKDETPGIGIKFTELSGQSLKAIRDYVKTH